MAKNLGGAIIDLLDSERVELRVAAATVLAVVGKGDKSVTEALTTRLGDSDVGVRTIALEGLAAMDLGGAGGFATKLVPLLRGDDEALANRAAQVLAQQGAAAEGALRKEVAAGPIPARRTMAQLLLRRGTQPAIDAVLDQLPDDEFGEQALQLVRAEIDAGNDKLAGQIEKSAVSRAGEAAKELHKTWAKAAEGRRSVAAEEAAKAAKAKTATRPAKTNGRQRQRTAMQGDAAPIRCAIPKSRAACPSSARCCG